MYKRIVILLVIFFTLSVILSGCIDDKVEDDNYNLKKSEKGIPPITIIDAPSVGYFGQEIEFSAKQSYDSDGDIISYKWIFGYVLRQGRRNLMHLET